MSRKNAILFCVFVGCALIANAGCRFHRTGRGFMLRSQWTLECENVPRLSFGDDSMDQPSVAQSEPEPKPELLRWRIRRRGYKLASRLLGRSGDSSDRKHDLFASTASSAEEQTPDVLPEAPEVPPEEALAMPAENADEHQSSKGHSPQRKPKLPDLVLD